MNMMLDITGGEELRVNYDECFVLTFLSFKSIPDVVDIHFRNLFVDWETPAKLKFQQTSGTCVIRFEQPSYIETSLTLLDHSGKEFLLDESGAPIVKESKWGIRDESAYTYELGGVCNSPNGDYGITIQSTKSVTLFKVIP